MKINYDDDVKVDPKTGQVTSSLEDRPAKMMFCDEMSLGNDTIVVRQPSAEEVYDEHFQDLNKSLDVAKVVASEFKGGFQRKDPKKLMADDEKNLAIRRRHIDEVDKPRLEAAMRPVTQDELDEMNQMATEWFGAEL